ncbi:uncharacterized protein LOC126848618 [Cataglyphis hispanica]|uniref:uncharacterized protein LOC126848618 n=1 Tax=Cataglyphis hispanica TaxID=1086592 RepID=UPI00217F7823|nr:uncharacterized protein LOC126848618 [Cataglyphis hispanica]
MHVEEKQIDEVVSNSELSDIINPVKHHKLFQRADKSHRNVKQRMNDVIKTEEFLSTSSETQSAGKYDISMSESNAVRQFEHVSWKYKNPYNVSIYNPTRYQKCNHTSENIFKEDEPQEGRTKSVLSNCREYLTNYQEPCGALCTEYSFAALIIVIAQATARSLWALIYVIVNIAPIIQMFSFILRFVLNKIIDIRRTKNIQQVMIKFAILAMQLLSVYVCLIFILGFIVLPIIQMAIGIVAKFVMHN